MLAKTRQTERVRRRMPFQAWLARLLPDRDVAPAVAREGLTLPAAPALAQRHSGQARHQVKLRRPRVAKWGRESLDLPVDDPVVVRDSDLGCDVVFLEAEMRRTDVERVNRLARRQTLKLGNVELDHKIALRLEMGGDVAE